MESFINFCKSCAVSDNKIIQYPLHFILEDVENNVVKIETKQYIKSPILFTKKIAGYPNVISICPIIKK